jgi:hypothetical protein
MNAQAVEEEVARQRVVELDHAAIEAILGLRTDHELAIY